MASLTSKGRARLPKTKFALPGPRKYPVQDKAHARNAKARASAQYKAGKLTKAQRDKIFAAANRVLRRR